MDYNPVTIRSFRPLSDAVSECGASERFRPLSPPAPSGRPHLRPESAATPGKVDYAVLGEPFLSIALRKDSTLQILADLNKPDSASLGFAQTAILYVPTLKKSKETMDSLLNASCRFAVEQPEQAICILEKENIFTFGMLTPESIERCKIDYKTVSEAQENILHFLQLIEQYEPKALGGKMPDEQFYK